MTDPRDLDDERRARAYRQRLDASLGADLEAVRAAEDIERRNRSLSNTLPVGDAGSHWVGCERVHPACRELLQRTGRGC